MGNLCASPAEFLQQFRSKDNRTSVDTLEVIIQQETKNSPKNGINESQKELLEMCHNDRIRRQFENKLKNENKIKYKIDALQNIEGFDYNGDLDDTRRSKIPSKKLLGAKVEINRTKNVYEKEIEHEVSTHNIEGDTLVLLSKEVGYYTKE